MRTVRLRLDEDLITDVDELAATLGMTRAALAQDALRAAVIRLARHELEKRHREGYRRKPVKRGEFFASIE